MNCTESQEILGMPSLHENDRSGMWYQGTLVNAVVWHGKAVPP